MEQIRLFLWQSRRKIDVQVHTRRMCGRYTLTKSPASVMRTLGITDAVPFRPRYNIGPGQLVSILLRDDRMSRHTLQSMQWGLVPSWTKDPDAAKKIINARAETVSEKPTFKGGAKYRRCLLPADGFYEWAKAGAGGKQPFYFQVLDGESFCFAGLWERWEDRRTGRVIESCVIITTAANELMKPIHDRMPVILDEKACVVWLDGGSQFSPDIRQLLVPFSAERMNARPVGRTVNNPAFDTSDCIVEENHG
jgi:putative SOS response-associated peptidase YedK